MAGLVKREISMDTPDTAQSVEDLFEKEKVVTIHSEEATLEDIFIMPEEPSLYTMKSSSYQLPIILPPPS